MREYNIGKMISEWEKVKKEQPDPMKRSFGDAVARTQYAEELNHEKIVPEGYNESLQRLKQAQSKLTPALLEKYPEASDIYNKAISEGVVDRTKTLGGIKESYQLTVPEMKKILGEEGFSFYTQDLGKVGKHMGSVFPGFADIMGTQEEFGDIPMYGLRSALMAQYKGEPRNIQDVTKSIKEYSNIYNKPKEIDTE